MVPAWFRRRIHLVDRGVHPLSAFRHHHIAVAFGRESVQQRHRNARLRANGEEYAVDVGEEEDVGLQGAARGLRTAVQLYVAILVRHAAVELPFIRVSADSPVVQVPDTALCGELPVGLFCELLQTADGLVYLCDGQVGDQVGCVVDVNENAQDPAEDGDGSGGEGIRSDGPSLTNHRHEAGEQARTPGHVFHRLPALGTLVVETQRETEHHWYDEQWGQQRPPNVRVQGL